MYHNKAINFGGQGNFIYFSVFGDDQALFDSAELIISPSYYQVEGPILAEKRKENKQSDFRQNQTVQFRLKNILYN